MGQPQPRMIIWLRNSPAASSRIGRARSTSPASSSRLPRLRSIPGLPGPSSVSAKMASAARSAGDPRPVPGAAGEQAQAAQRHPGGSPVAHVAADRERLLQPFAAQLELLAGAREVPERVERDRGAVRVVALAVQRPGRDPAPRARRRSRPGPARPARGRTACSPAPPRGRPRGTGAAVSSKYMRGLPGAVAVDHEADRRGPHRGVGVAGGRRKQVEALLA